MDVKASVVRFWTVYKELRRLYIMSVFYTLLPEEMTPVCMIEEIV